MPATVTVDFVLLLMCSSFNCYYCILTMKEDKKMGVKKFEQNSEHHPASKCQRQNTTPEGFSSRPQLITHE